MDTYPQQPAVRRIGPAALIRYEKLPVPEDKRRPHRPSDCVRLKPGAHYSRRIWFWPDAHFPFTGEAEDPEHRLQAMLAKGGRIQVDLRIELADSAQLSAASQPGEGVAWGRFCAPTCEFDYRVPTEK